MKEKDTELKNFLDNIQSRILKKNIIVAILSVFITLFVLGTSILVYYNVKFPIQLNTVFVEWVAEESTTEVEGKKVLNSISFEITNIGKQFIADAEIRDEGDITIIKINGNLGNKYYSTKSFSQISVKDKKAVYIEGKNENDRMLVWEKDMDIMTKEEWNKWYYDVYALRNPMIRFQKSIQN